MLKGKNILIGITGAIAAYKICELIRLFKKNGANVDVVITPNALNFVTKTTIEALSQSPLNVNAFEIDEYKPEHISLTDKADIFVIAPITANTIGKITHGICDNLLTSTFCAFKKPVIIAPCMNSNMWENKVTQDNIQILKNRGVKVIEPQTGFLACGAEGKGRLADINIIFEETKNILLENQLLLCRQKTNLSQPPSKPDLSKNAPPGAFLSAESLEGGAKLCTDCSPVSESRNHGSASEVMTGASENNFKTGQGGGETKIPKLPGLIAGVIKGKKIIITAGGTREDIDTVRYIGNYSSGKMGISLADCAFEFGADVVLISTVEVQKPYKVINVKTADEMLNAVDSEFKSADSLIMAAAVGDYRVKNKQNHKIKKNGRVLNIELIENTDILKEMSDKKEPNKIVVGFCAESENLIENAKIKIQNKGCDFICANDISRTDVGFSSDYNELYIVDKNLNIEKIEKTDKKTAAKMILERIYGKSIRYNTKD